MEASKGVAVRCRSFRSSRFRAFLLFFFPFCQVRAFRHSGFGFRVGGLRCVGSFGGWGFANLVSILLLLLLLCLRRLRREVIQLPFLIYGVRA